MSAVVGYKVLLSFEGCGGRVRVFREAAAGDAVLRAQLLRRVRQRRRHDVRRRDAHVLLSNTEGMYVK